MSFFDCCCTADATVQRLYRELVKDLHFATKDSNRMACRAPLRLLLVVLVTVVVFATWATTAAADQIFSARIGELKANMQNNSEVTVALRAKIFVRGSAKRN